MNYRRVWLVPVFGKTHIRGKKPEPTAYSIYTLTDLTGQMYRSEFRVEQAKFEINARRVNGENTVL